MSTNGEYLLFCRNKMNGPTIFKQAFVLDLASVISLCVFVCSENYPNLEQRIGIIQPLELPCVVGVDSKKTCINE